MSTLIISNDVAERLNHLEQKINIIYSAVMNQQKEDELLTGEQARVLLGVSKSTWQSMRDQKRIAFSQIGRKIYVKRSDIEKYINRHIINKK